MARRLNKNTEGDAGEKPPPIVTDEIISKHLKTCTAAKAVLDSANGSYRSALKDAKAAGIHSGDVTWYIHTKKREPEDVNAEFTRRIKIARIGQLPLDIIDPATGKTVADAIEQEHAAHHAAKAARKGNGRAAGHAKPSKKALKEAAKAGEVAGASGKSKESCGLSGPERAAWEKGWLASQADIVNPMGKKAGAGAAGTTAH